MQRQKKQQQKMLASLENGQVVITSGGIVGTVVAIDNDIWCCGSSRTTSRSR